MDLHKRIAALELDHPSVTAAEYEAAIYARRVSAHAARSCRGNSYSAF